MSPIIIYTAVFFGVAALVGAVAFIMRGDREAEVEERLSVLTGGKKGRGKADAAQYKELLAAMRDDGTGAVEKFVSRYLNLRLLFEQADVSMPVPQVPDDLRRPGRRSACVLPTRRPGSACVLAPLMAVFLGVLADRVAAVASASGG